MINIRYVLLCLKDKKIEISAFLLSIILFIEIYCNYEILNNQSKYIEKIPKIESKMELKDIINNFSEAGLNIISIEDKEDRYIIGLSLNGRKDDIIKSFKFLIDKYNIIYYEFNASYDNIEGKISLTYN
ncbi:hypothetical protein SAMN04487886_100159 [Clostridium sp. DSM 8431]|uniref:hypothetical protein n=1 Tax=Clostridium sp. DSM 8431 TaxID=1761781 RepID=UPI0008E6CBE2|nr:hypothetical protein [Clostridium sp. DSM 8431]SFU28672.1 hypothetical protein SAMN04487886_100159 [Clostridium sp. DSM 8431]